MEKDVDDLLRRRKPKAGQTRPDQSVGGMRVSLVYHIYIYIYLEMIASLVSAG